METNGSHMAYFWEHHQTLERTLHCFCICFMGFFFIKVKVYKEKYYIEKMTNNNITDLRLLRACMFCEDSWESTLTPKRFMGLVTLYQNSLPHHFHLHHQRKRSSDVEHLFETGPVDVQNIVD